MALEDRYENMLDSCVESLTSWKQLIADHLDGEEKTAEMEKLRQVTRDYCDLNASFQKSLKAVHNVEQQLDDNNTPIKDIQKLYENNLKNKTEASQKNYKDNDFWKRVFKGLSDVMEVRQKETNIDESQFEAIDDSMLCSNVFTPPIDPISKTVIRNPYKSKKCKHVYEYSTITSYIKQQKRKAKCPYIGCKSVRLLMEDLVQDSQLQNEITKYIESQCNEESQDEEDD